MTRLGYFGFHTEMEKLVICRTRLNYRVDDLMGCSSLSSLLSVVIILGEPLMYSVSCWKIVPSSV